MHISDEIVLFCFRSVLTEISKMIPLSTSHLWFKILSGTKQASCHYMKQRWPFWQMHMWVIWPQWVNELNSNPCLSHCAANSMSGVYSHCWLVPVSNSLKSSIVSKPHDLYIYWKIFHTAGPLWGESISHQKCCLQIVNHSVQASLWDNVIPLVLM